MITKEQLQEIVTKAHMEGQMYAGCNHPSFGDAIGYYLNNVVKKLDLPVINCSTCKHHEVSKYVEPCYTCIMKVNYPNHESAIVL